MSKPKILILGFGKLGRAFHQLTQDRYTIEGVKRHPLPDEPCTVHPMPIRSPDLIPHLKWAEIVVFSPAPGRHADDILSAYRDTYLQNLQAVIHQIHEHKLSIRCLLVIGTTGVYPKKTGGSWTEERAIPAESERQEILLQTEKIAIQSGLPFVILRCGGIYGPGRGNFSWMAKKEKILTSELTDESFSLIHQDDLCNVVDVVIRDEVSREIFNVTDNSSFSRADLYCWFSRHTGIPLVEDGPAPPVTPRDISNTRMKRVLGYVPRSPDIIQYLGK